MEYLSGPDLAPVLPDEAWEMVPNLAAPLLSGATGSPDRPAAVALQSGRGKEDHTRAGGTMIGPPSSHTKYRRLYEYLAGLPRESRALILTFGDIARILGEPLPKSASMYAAWWSNDENPDSSHVQCRAWLAAGWRTVSVSSNQQRRQMQFERM